MHLQHFYQHHYINNGFTAEGLRSVARGSLYMLVSSNFTT
jgi:hypothetical protein